METAGKTLSVCAFAVAMLLGVSGRSAAEPVGPSGHTVNSCHEIVDGCIATCAVDLAGCYRAPGASEAACDIAYEICAGACISANDTCIPRAAAADWRCEALVKEQLRTREDLGALSAKIGTASPPDLVPLPRPASVGPEGLCQLSADLTKLQVQVINQGSVPSGASTTRVVFANGGAVDTPTQALGAGSSVTVAFSIPADCYDAAQTCHFTIGVDSTSTVIESNEVNNNAAGICGASIQ